MSEVSMRDRIARGLMDLAGCEDGDDGFRACVPDTCSCRRVAGELLAIMRKPTENMVTAGEDAPIGHSWGRTNDKHPSGEYFYGADCVWEGMIDEALKA